MKENHSHEKDNNNQGILPVLFFYSHKINGLMVYKIKLCDSIFNIFNTKDAIMFNILFFHRHTEAFNIFLSGFISFILHVYIII